MDGILQKSHVFPPFQRGLESRMLVEKLHIFLTIARFILSRFKLLTLLTFYVMFDHLSYLILLSIIIYFVMS
jgi:hypothetical protein